MKLCEKLLTDVRYPEFNKSTNGMTEEHKNQFLRKIKRQLFDKYEDKNDYLSIPDKYIPLWVELF